MHSNLQSFRVFMHSGCAKHPCPSFGMQTGIINGRQALCCDSIREKRINMRKLSILLVAVFAFTSVLFAQQDSQESTPATKSELFAGYSYLHSNLQNESLGSAGLNGLTLQYTRFVLNNVGITADVTRATASNIQQGQNSVTRYTYLFGPTYEVRSNSALTPYVHVLFGSDHERFDVSQEYDVSTNSLAIAFGGGFDANMNNHIAFRLGQFDLIHTNHTTGENHFRYSAGVVFKF